MLSLRSRPFCLSRNLNPVLSSDVDPVDEPNGVRTLKAPTMSRSFEKFVARICELKNDCARFSFCGSGLIFFLLGPSHFFYGFRIGRRRERLETSLGRPSGAPPPETTLPAMDTSAVLLDVQKSDDVHTENS